MKCESQVKTDFFPLSSSNDLRNAFKYKRPLWSLPWSCICLDIYSVAYKCIVPYVLEPLDQRNIELDTTIKARFHCSSVEAKRGAAGNGVVSVRNREVTKREGNQLHNESIWCKISQCYSAIYLSIL